MRAFRFRAEAALDLRRREETAALLAKSHAEARFAEAEQAVAAEQARRDRAQADAVAVERRGADVGTLLWHRNWIVRLASNVDTRSREAAERARERDTAHDAWQSARQRRLALERLRERALQAFDRAVLREERNALDELARIRFLMPAEEGIHRDHD